ncbi:MAG: hypothetical protein HZB26_10835 [Candidatus Hydrogenedentes bacterium]|nr:hypothetical protein [Candidatus Hydrogenedentota bacterium]
MKKLLAVIIACAFALTGIACGGGGGATEDKPGATSKKARDKQRDAEEKAGAAGQQQ